MSSISCFPVNIHKGIKIFFLACIFALVVGIIAVVVALWEANVAAVTGMVSFKTLKTICTVSKVLSYCVMALQLIGVNLASRDEPYFHKASIAQLIAIAFTVLSEFVHQRPVESARSIASLCVTVFIIKGMMNTALRLKNVKMYSEGKALFVAVLVVTFAPTGLLLLAAVTAALKSVALIGLLVICFLTAAVVVSIWQLVYMGKAIKMTDPDHVQVEEEPWNQPEQPNFSFSDNNF